MNLQQEAERRINENRIRLKVYTNIKAIERIATSLAVDDTFLAMEDANRTDDLGRFIELKEIKKILEQKLLWLDEQRIKEKFKERLKEELDNENKERKT